MRVLHVFKTYLPDFFAGVERVIWQIAEGTAPLGVESTVLFLSNQQSGEGAISRHKTFAARRDLYIASTGISFSVAGAFASLARQHDIVHYHFPWPMMDLLELSIGHGMARIVTYHSDIVRQKMLSRFYAPVMHSFLRRMDRIVATSPNYVKTSSVLARYADKTSVIPIGIDKAPAPDAELVNHWRRRVGEGFFLFVGALRYYKGVPFLLAAARQTGLPIIIAGSGEMATEVAAAGLANVIAVGEVTEADKLALLSLASVFVFPSHLRSEAFGVALLEAARAGKAMICCEIGTGTSYINVDGVTGLTVPPADPLALAAAMNELWLDRQRAGQMGQAARRRYEDVFTAQTMADSYFTTYHSLLHQR